MSSFLSLLIISSGVLAGVFGTFSLSPRNDSVLFSLNPNNSALEYATFALTLTQSDIPQVITIQLYTSDGSNKPMNIYVDISNRTYFTAFPNETDYFTSASSVLVSTSGIGLLLRIENPLTIYFSCRSSQAGLFKLSVLGNYYGSSQSENIAIWIIIIIAIVIVAIALLVICGASKDDIKECIIDTCVSMFCQALCACCLRNAKYSNKNNNNMYTTRRYEHRYKDNSSTLSCCENCDW